MPLAVNARWGIANTNVVWTFNLLKVFKQAFACPVWCPACGGDQHKSLRNSLFVKRIHKNNRGSYHAGSVVLLRPQALQYGSAQHVTQSDQSRFASAFQARMPNHSAPMRGNRTVKPADSVHT